MDLSLKERDRISVLRQVGTSINATRLRLDKTETGVGSG